MQSMFEIRFAALVGKVFSATLKHRDHIVTSFEDLITG
jgi:hypothetical protein